MFSEFPPLIGLGKTALEWMTPQDAYRDPAFQAASVRQGITSAENEKVRNPISDPRTPDSFSGLEQTPVGPSVPIKTAAGWSRV